MYRKVLKRPKLKQKTSFNGYEKNITNVNTNKEIEVSASEIRKKLSLGKSIKYLVPKEVEKIILEKRYYSKEEKC